MKNKIRTGCVDIWNAFMVVGAKFSAKDIPFCSTTAKISPQNLIPYDEAKTIYNKHLKRGDKNLFGDAFVHFYIDDYKFDGRKSGIWFDWKSALKILRHFAGIITPDFSTCVDFPEPLKIWNTYRMRAFGYWLGKNNIQVINNVRWGTEETFSYCFDGIPTESIISIGTVASGLHNSINRKIFSDGFDKMLEVLKPKKIIVYGSDNYHCFDKVRREIEIIHFRSRKDLAMRGESNE